MEPERKSVRYNAACESFMKTLKYEEVYRNEYRDRNEAAASIRRVPRSRLISRGSTRLWATCHRRSLSVAKKAEHEIAFAVRGRSRPGHSGRWVDARVAALPYPPPLRCFQSGATQYSPAILLQRTATTPLTLCLTPGVHSKLITQYNSTLRQAAAGSRLRFPGGSEKTACADERTVSNDHVSGQRTCMGAAVEASADYRRLSPARQSRARLPALRICALRWSTLAPSHKARRNGT
jgi:hypothetical protein